LNSIATVFMDNCSVHMRSITLDGALSGTSHIVVRTDGTASPPVANSDSLGITTPWWRTTGQRMNSARRVP
jgi:hypothetical protein